VIAAGSAEVIAAIGVGDIAKSGSARLDLQLA
jgi:hypothetical protein